VIEPTDEMLDAYDDAAREHPVGLGELRVPNVREGLAAVLAIVERDYRIEPRPPWDPPWHCTKCGSRLQACADPDCVDPAQCGEPWCAHHTPDGTW
jgi:hypothetical protein